MPDQLCTSGNGIYDAEAVGDSLSACCNLEVLDLARNSVSDHRPLQRLVALPLTRLSLLGNPVSISAAFKLDSLSWFPSLKYLNAAPVAAQQGQPVPTSLASEALQPTMLQQGQERQPGAAASSSTGPISHRLYARQASSSHSIGHLPSMAAAPPSVSCLQRLHAQTRCCMPEIHCACPCIIRMICTVEYPYSRGAGVIHGRRLGAQPGRRVVAQSVRGSSCLACL